jgi:2-dehydropantoate 2-reductase
MQFGVMGAGAVGCYYGALLARAGHEVTLIGRPSFVERVRAAGLCLEKDGATEIVHPRVDTDAAALSGCETVLFCVKSGDTEVAGQAMAAYLGPQHTVFTFQNGVDNADRLTGVLRRPVVPAVLYVAVEMIGDAHVRHHGRGDVVLGLSDASESTAQALRAAGIPASVSAEVLEALWGKLITNCAYNAMSAVTNMPYGSMLQVEGVAQVMRDVAEECVAVGRGLGIALPPADMERVLGLAASMPGQYSSTAQDLARHRPTEIEYLNGYVVRQGTALGIPTPANRVLLMLVRLLESKVGAAADRSRKSN